MSGEPPLSQRAEELLREPGSWAAQLVAVAREDELSGALVEALEDAQIYADRGGEVRLCSAAELLAAQRGAAPSEGQALVVNGLAALSPAQRRALDRQRDRFVGEGVVVLLLPVEELAPLRAALPNIWSLLGGRIWPAPAGPAADLDVQASLAALRARFGFSDTELLDKVKARAITVDPYVTEWLVLLGQGELLDA